MFLLILPLLVTPQKITSKSSEYIIAYEEFCSISTNKQIDETYQIKWSYKVDNGTPHITVLLMSQHNYEEWLKVSSLESIEYTRLSYETANELSGKLNPPYKANWTIVFINHDYSNPTTQYLLKISLTAYNPTIYTLIAIPSILFVLITISIIVIIIQRKEKRRQFSDQSAANQAKLGEEPLNRKELLKSINQFYNRLPLKTLSSMLRFDSLEEMETWRLSLPQELKFFIENNEAIFPRTVTIAEEKLVEELVLPNITDYDKEETFLCSNCSSELHGNIEKCPNCQEIVRCLVCKLPIFRKEDKCKCPNCENIGHFLHFNAWVDAGNNCPKCREKMTTKDLIVIITKNSQ